MVVCRRRELGRPSDDELIDSRLQRLKGLVWPRGGLQLSITIDQKDCRIASDISIEVRNITMDGEKRITYRHLFQEIPLRRGIFIGKPEDNESLIFPRLIQAIEPGHFCPARAAPRGPDVHEDYVTAVVGQTLGFPVEVEGFKGRRSDVSHGLIS